MIKEVKKEQLGMNLTTARNRLLKDIVFMLLVETGRTSCHQCGKQLTKDDFSIEHVIPWLHSENPVDLYFDLSNISFSHVYCNATARRNRRPPPEHGTASKYASGCRCVLCIVEWRKYKKEKYDPEKRSQKYRNNGT